jgi:murein L,D-transpeptidase YafK
MRHLVLAVGTVVLVGQAAEASDCPNDQAMVVVDTAAHTLRLCEKGAVTKAFRVALGSGGTGKTKEGDNKTPLGEYSLGTPRPSVRFGVFIPVGYPTPEQAARGLTGADIGIHGPDRQFAWLGRATLWFDWTAGCVAVGTDSAIQAIAAWVKARKVDLVQLK